jgi:hypothetical protein
MLAAITEAGGSVHSVRLHIVDGYVADKKATPSPGPLVAEVPALRGTTITDLTMDDSGDYRATQTVDMGAMHYVGDFGYDELRHELRTASQSADDGVIILRPAWYTDFHNIDVFYLSFQADANTVRALLAAADPNMPVIETTYLGRPAWQATFLDDYRTGKQTVVVDRETGLLLAADRSWPTEKGDKLVSVTRVTQMEADPTLAKDWQVVPSLKTTSGRLRWNYFRDDGTRFGTPKSVAALSSPTPVVLPAWTPSGYDRADLATAVYGDPRPAYVDDNSWHYSKETVRRPSGSTPGVSVSKRLALRRCSHLVKALYRRSFDTFTVTIEPRSDQKPVEQVTAGRRGSHDVELADGFFSGSTARVWIGSTTFTYQFEGGRIEEEVSQGPTLLAYTGDWRVVISGDLTAQELVDVANSLQVYGETASPSPSPSGKASPSPAPKASRTATPKPRPTSSATATPKPTPTPTSPATTPSPATTASPAASGQ